MIGGNRQALTDVLHLLVPTTDLLNRYHEALWCGIGGSRHRSRSRPTSSPGHRGVGRPHARQSSAIAIRQDLPKVAAKGGPYCKELGLPDVPPEFGRRSSSLMSARTRIRYGNQGILLDSEGLKNWLFGPIDGPPRNSAQIGMPG